MKANLTVVEVTLIAGKATLEKSRITEHFTGSAEEAKEKTAEYARRNSSQNNSDVFYVCYLNE